MRQFFSRIWYDSHLILKIDMPKLTLNVADLRVASFEPASEPVAFHAVTGPACVVTKPTLYSCCQ